MITDLFSIIFLFVMFACFYLVKGRARVILLSIGSLLYAFYVSVAAAAAVLTTSVIVYLFSLLLEKKRKRMLFGILLGFMVALLLVLKFAIPVGGLLGASPDGFVAKIMIPIGFSFYIFSAISYLSDIYRQKTTADRNFFNVLLYLTWFPKFISGPIERKDEFDTQIKKAMEIRFPQMGQIAKAAVWFSFGLFLKIVVANRLGIDVDKAFTEYNGLGSIDLLLGSLAYTMQIYCDFAGYSNMAIGASLLFGIELVQNFETPYMSPNITDFWRRWHISLGSFLRDYVYIPMGGNRKGFKRKLLNVMTVFLVCGIWHGSGFCFVIWGALHGFYSVIDNLFAHFGIERLRHGLIGRILTFLSVSFAWIFFRAANIKEAFSYIVCMFTNTPSAWGFLRLVKTSRKTFTEIVLALLFTALVIVLDIIAERRKCLVPELILKEGLVFKCACVIGLIMISVVLGVYGQSPEAEHFIYMQF